jgi:hypothetical protein
MTGALRAVCPRALAVTTVGGTCGVLKTSFWPNIASAHPKNIRDFFFVARFSGSFMLLQLHAAAAAQVMKFVSPGIITI